MVDQLTAMQQLTNTDCSGDMKHYLTLLTTQIQDLLSSQQSQSSEESAKIHIELLAFIDQVNCELKELKSSINQLQTYVISIQSSIATHGVMISAVIDRWQAIMSEAVQSNAARECELKDLIHQTQQSLQILTQQIEAKNDNDNDNQASINRLQSALNEQTVTYHQHTLNPYISTHSTVCFKHWCGWKPESF